MNPSQAAIIFCDLWIYLTDNGPQTLEAIKLEFVESAVSNAGLASLLNNLVLTGALRLVGDCYATGDKEMAARFVSWLQQEHQTESPSQG